MRFWWIVLAVMLAALQMPAAMADWKTVSLSGLTMQVPSDAQLVRRAGGIRIESARFWLDLRLGPTVQDLDDGEPARCYNAEPVALGTRQAVLRVSRRDPRLDCPDRYVSLFLPERTGDALFLQGEGTEYEDLDRIRAIVATIRFDN